MALAFEKPEAQKTPHGEVGYESPSRKGSETCSNCIHLVVPAFDRTAAIRADQVRCETVKDPIRLADRCVRWQDRG